MITFLTINQNWRVENRQLYNKWINRVVKEESSNRVQVANISIHLCDNKFIREHNREFLNHNYATDIITFDNSVGNTISGELLISLERVKENALEYGSNERDELNRVIIHGILHLIGYKDSNQKEIDRMIAAEERALKLFLQLEEQSKSRDKDSY